MALKGLSLRATRVPVGLASRDVLTVKTDWLFAMRAKAGRDLQLAGAHRKPASATKPAPEVIALPFEVLKKRIIPRPSVAQSFLRV
jgi:hypothetical protein